MADLDTLRPEVMEAAAKLDDFDSAFGTGGHWQIIRAELLRLTDENVRLEQFARSCISAGGESVFRATKAEAELAKSRETIKRLNRRAQVAEAGVVEKVKEHAGGSLGRALANAAAEMFRRERDEAQAELAALKARILPGTAKVEIADTDGPDGDPYGWVGGTLLSHDLIGKRVRLVVEE